MASLSLLFAASFSVSAAPLDLPSEPLDLKLRRADKFPPGFGSRVGYYVMPGGIYRIAVQLTLRVPVALSFLFPDTGYPLVDTTKDHGRSQLAQASLSDLNRIAFSWMHRVATVVYFQYAERDVQSGITTVGALADYPGAGTFLGPSLGEVENACTAIASRMGIPYWGYLGTYSNPQRRGKDDGVWVGGDGDLPPFNVTLAKRAATCPAHGKQSTLNKYLEAAQPRSFVDSGSCSSLGT